MNKFEKASINQCVLFFVILSMAGCVFSLVRETSFEQLDYVSMLMLVLILVLQVVYYLLLQHIQKVEHITNPVTGLYNIQKFWKDLEKSLLLPEAANRVFMVSLDINEFRNINDILGYKNGTRILREIGGVLLKNLSNQETCYHIRDDLFYLIMVGDNPEQIIQRVYAKLESISLHFRDDESLNMFFAGGCYQFDESIIKKLRSWEDKSISYVSIKEVMTSCENKANYARKKVKKHNQNAILFFHESMQEQENLNKLMEYSFLPAMTKREFKAYYQPKYCNKNGEFQICGAEALVRWDSQDLGFLYPGHFMHIFTNNENSVLLDMYMTKMVCQHIRDWLDQGLAVHPISVNVSRNTISSDSDYLRYVEHLVKTYSIPRDLLEFEILETDSEQEESKLIEFINAFQDEGFKIAMDDFGTGMSSLGFLNKVSFDTLKLDKSFFDSWRLGERGRAEAIVNSILSLAKELGITTVAEGIEEAFQVDLLNKMGCDIIQGYYFSRPISSEDYLVLLEKQ